MTDSTKQDVLTTIGRKAATLRREKPELTEDQAVAEVVMREPRLYSEYQQATHNAAREANRKRFGEALMPPRRFTVGSDDN